MPNLLPMTFIVLCALALGAMLYWLWLSVQRVFAHVGSSGVQAAVGASERAQLLAEKQHLLLALKDLEAEREGGKLGQDDYEELNTRYRGRAREVLRALDAQTAPHREAARALLREATGEASAKGASSRPSKRAVAQASTQATVAAANSCASCGASNDPDAAFCKKCGTPAPTENAANSCASCGTSNDPDAVFCKKCGTRVATQSPS
ncbi:MAG TPA: zinc ribbon domain-containing protein [Polyangiales bacterium]